MGTETVRPDFPSWIDSTARKDFDACPTKFYWSHIRGLRRKGGNVHLVFGGTLAKGLETFRKAYYGEGKQIIDCYTDALHAMILEWGDFEEPEGTAKTFANCVLALMAYFEQYNPAEDVVRPYMHDGEPAVEFSFALPIPGVFHPQTGDPILYTGRFDMLGTYGNSVFVVDEKTASQLGQGWQAQWRLASQLTGYCWAAQQFGYKVQGAIIRGVGIYKTYFAHQMVIQQRPQWMLDRWLRQLQRDVRRMISLWEEGEWDMSLDSACSNYGGCPFMTLCESPMPENWVETEYEISGWNPLE